MKLPLRVAGLVTLKSLDALMGVIQAVVDWNSRRVAKKDAETPRGLSFKDVAHIEKQIAESTARRSAKTVVIPRPKP